jgi:hypothetical protein
MTCVKKAINGNWRLETRDVLKAADIIPLKG